MLLNQLIHIPDQVQDSDFVLRLSEGITDPSATLRHYQVTENLSKCFGEALELVKSSVTSSQSKGSYLHGSFGSGKSHFMAVLHLLLSGNEEALRTPELAGPVATHKDFLDGKKFLLVPYHLLGATSLESKILGGYADYVSRHHPDAPVPAIYPSAALFENATGLRANMGDETFFKVLNQGQAAGGGGGWGALGATWDASSFDSALAAHPSSEEANRLVSALVETHFPAMQHANDFVPLDEGLLAISRHAKELGYDAVILFLDELVLWLASHAGDQEFLSREGEKVVKLVEAQGEKRPIPLVSFIARQRDLTELIGQHVTGAEKMAFTDVLKHHDGRFGVIKLEDRNLPAIAQKRILAPVSESAKDQIDAEFERTASQHAKVVDILKSKHSTREHFRDLYPFSPALVETLVAVSFLLQRERTALKVMARLLSDQKSSLQLGQIVPVGDLFDYVSQGNDAFNADMKMHFQNARDLYQQRLAPRLEEEHGITLAEAAALPWNDAKRSALRNDDRLIKTALLAALVPEVEALKSLTPERLAALNHGSIKSFLAGQEAGVVLKKFQNWAASAGQIKIQQASTGQTISIQLANIDVDRILAKAEGHDNHGNRTSKLKELLFEALNVTAPDDQLRQTHRFTWRGTPREVELLFGNIRKMPDNALQAGEDSAKLIIDYPFDDGHGVNEDLEKLTQFANSQEPTRTICWLPSFFNAQTNDMLGTFVKLEHILKEQTFPSFVNDLSEVDRGIARNQLESQRGELRNQLISRLEAAYGIRSDSSSLDPVNTVEGVDQFRSLSPDITLQAPVGANLSQALGHLLDQALRQQFPAHPTFDEGASLTNATLARVLTVIQAACQDENSSHLYDQAQKRHLFHLISPLKLGEVSEQRLTMRTHWRDHFERLRNQGGFTEVPVRDLRDWIDQPTAMGLPRNLQDLIILAYAEATNRTVQEHGATVPAKPGELRDHQVLVETKLLDEETWERAKERVKALFGHNPGQMRNLHNVTALAQAVENSVKDLQEALTLPNALKEALSKIEKITEPFKDTPDRLKMAEKASELTRSLQQATGQEALKKLASFQLEHDGVALSKTLKSAAQNLQVLQSTQWSTFESLGKLPASEAISQITGDLRKTLSDNEYLVSLSERLPKLQQRALNAITDAATRGTPQPAPQPTPEPTPTPLPPVTVPPIKPAPGKPAPRRSQIRQEQDLLPSWVNEETRTALLRQVSLPTTDGGTTEIVLGPLYEALVALDGQAEIDPAAQQLHLHRLGQSLALADIPTA